VQKPRIHLTAVDSGLVCSKQNTCDACAVPVKEKLKKHKPIVLSDHHDAGGSDSDGDQFAAAQAYFSYYVLSSTKICFAFAFAFECFALDHCFLVFISTPTFYVFEPILVQNCNSLACLHKTMGSCSL
jgi:hypothetical protein